MRPEDHSADRYHRQALVPDIGPDGQRYISSSCALIVGVGALGCAAADHLARAGVGRLVLVDRDVVEWTNLHRQCLFEEQDAREHAPKAIAAARRLSRVNSAITITPEVTDLTPRNARSMVVRHRPAVLLDSTDNYQTRFLMNDLAVSLRIPLVYAGVLSTFGMRMTVVAGSTPCLRCVFDGPPATPGETCDTAGVIGPAAGVAASMQAAEALKILAGRADAVSNRLERFDLWKSTHASIDLSGSRRADCPCCSEGRYEFLDGEAADTAATLCGRGAVQIWPGGIASVDLGSMLNRLSPHGSFSLTPVTLRGTLRETPADADGPIELTVFGDGRTIVRGTTRVDLARSIHARYIGS